MIRQRAPDKAKARSIVKAAEIDMSFIEKHPTGMESGQSIIRGIYENFRMLGDALLISKGFETTGLDHHNQMINALTILKITTSRPLLLLHELRKLRHNINYEGHIPNESELKYAVEIKEALWKPVLAEVKKEIEK